MAAVINVIGIESFNCNRLFPAPAMSNPMPCSKAFAVLPHNVVIHYIGLFEYAEDSSPVKRRPKLLHGKK